MGCLRRESLRRAADAVRLLRRKRGPAEVREQRDLRTRRAYPGQAWKKGFRRNTNINISENEILLERVNLVKTSPFFFFSEDIHEKIQNTRTNCQTWQHLKNLAKVGQHFSINRIQTLKRSVVWVTISKSRYFLSWRYSRNTACSRFASR